MGGGGGIGVEREAASMRCPICGATGQTARDIVHGRSCRFYRGADTQAARANDDDIVPDLIVAAAVDTLMSSDFSSDSSSFDTSTPDTSSDFGGFDGGDSGGGGASGDF